MYHSDINQNRPFGRLDDLRFFEGGVGAVFLDRFQSLYGHVNDDGLTDLRNEDAAALEIGLAAHLARRIELGSTGTVRVPPADLRALSSDFADTCHSRRMLAYNPV